MERKYGTEARTDVHFGVNMCLGQQMADNLLTTYFNSEHVKVASL